MCFLLKVSKWCIIGLAEPLFHSMLFHYIPGHVFHQTLMLHMYVRVGSYLVDEAIKAT